MMKKVGLDEVAIGLIKNSVIWLCDRYEQGDGLEGFEALPLEEIEVLFGGNFDFVSAQQISDSYLATVLSDLSAIIENADLYSDVINDIKATKIFLKYWQVPDNGDLLIIDGRSIISYPNITYSDTMHKFTDYDFADHISHEPINFRLSELVGVDAMMTLTILLRDRYFPTLWSQLIE
jgi:hypothetical protein